MSQQLGLDYAAPAPTPVQTRHRAADRALAKVTRERGRLWLEQARQAVRLYGAQHADGWLLEDARAWAEAEGVIQPPANPKAWGGVVRQLLQRGEIAQVGARRSASNACLKPTWKIVPKKATA